MADNRNIQGIWKGEYTYDRKYEHPLITQPVPFILRIKTVDDSGLFEGMCQDDPEIGLISLSAVIYGMVKPNGIFFTKKYSKTMTMDAGGNVIIGEESHPDIMYECSWSESDRFFGTWRAERTFRKVNEKVIEMLPIHGAWWIER
jgi:hypothetical protein